MKLLYWRRLVLFYFNGSCQVPTHLFSPKALPTTAVSLALSRDGWLLCFPPFLLVSFAVLQALLQTLAKSHLPVIGCPVVSKTPFSGLSASSKHKAAQSRSDDSHFGMVFCSIIGSAAGFGAVYSPYWLKLQFMHSFTDLLGVGLCVLEPLPSKG